MAKIKKISINAMDKVIKDTYTPAIVLRWHDLDLQIKYNLTFVEMMEFVDSVYRTCFTSEGGVYTPEAKELAIKNNILSKYTNLSLPSNLEHLYKFIYCTNIVETVLEHINRQQFDEMLVAIDAKIENRARANIEQVNKRVSELYVMLDNLQTRISHELENVDIDDALMVAKALTDGNIDEHKLVEAYMAYNQEEVNNDTD